MGKLQHIKHEAFCLEYMVDKCGTDAYYRAGYTPKSRKCAEVSSSRLLSNVKSGVPARIKELEAEFAERSKIDVDKVLKRYTDIIEADHAALTKIIRGACRYCHGVDHDYQWRTVREFEAEVASYLCREDAKKVHAHEPDCEGGFGYNATRDPHPDCPECDGHGLVRTYLADTDKLPPEARALFAGVKTSKDGIEVKTHSQMDALDRISKHLGFYEKDNSRKHDVTDRLQDWLTDMSAKGSKAALTTRRTIDPDDEKGEPDA